MTASHISSRQAFGVWVFLVVASVATAWLGDHHGIFGSWTVAVVMLVAVAKARAIVLYYMDIKFSPLKLRIPFELWLLVSGCIILGFWTAGPGGS